MGFLNKLSNAFRVNVKVETKSTTGFSPEQQRDYEKLFAEHKAQMEKDAPNVKDNPHVAKLIEKAAAISAEAMVKQRASVAESKKWLEQHRSEFEAEKKRAGVPADDKYEP